MIVPETMIIESNGYSPEFLQLFTDRKTSIGSTVKFEARVTGSQPLNVNLSFPYLSNTIILFVQVYWLFNASPIARLGNYQQNVVNDTYTLTIQNVRYEDIGRYSLNAENTWGKATCSAELFIPPTIARIGRILLLTIALDSIHCTLMLDLIDSIHRDLFVSIEYIVAFICFDRYYLECFALHPLSECSFTIRYSFLLRLD